jgi:hypothetical protein
MIKNQIFKFRETARRQPNPFWVRGAKKSHGPMNVNFKNGKQQARSDVSLAARFRFTNGLQIG